MNREMLFRGKRIDNGEWMPLPEPCRQNDEGVEDDAH